MTLQRRNMLEIQGKKVDEVGDDVDANNNDIELLSDFLREANEDILLEIFVHLRNCRSAILFGSVCRYWHTLISGPQFIPRFISHHHDHQDRYSLPYTIILRRADRIGLGNGGYDYYRPLCKLFSEESMILHGKSVTSVGYLDFLPCRMVIRASCNDLLLANPGGREYLGTRWSKSDNLYICNPITKQFYLLPMFDRPSRWFRITGHALVCMPPAELGSPTNHFKVIEFYDLGRDDDAWEEPLNSEKPIIHVMSVFCSKSGKWGREGFQCPRPNGFSPYDSAKEMEEIVTCNGIAYWLENIDVDRVIALDLLNRECGVIVFPDDYWWFLQAEDDFHVRKQHSFLWRYRQYQDSHVREQIGAVCGEVRLLQVVLTGAELILNLKVWKLNYNSKEWILVHDKKNLKCPSNDDTQQFIAAFVHPTNRDVVLLVWDRNIFQYNLNTTEDTYEKVDEIEESLDIEYRTEQAEQFGWNERLVSVPMVHPPWPTTLPNSV
ncbi:U3 snoRNP protein [Orobanche hederae]